MVFSDAIDLEFRLDVTRHPVSRYLEAGIQYPVH